MIKKIISYILYIVGFSSAILASGIKEIANWYEIARPFFLVFVISISIALTMTYFNKIRRVTYPVLVCFSAWVYKHKLLRTTFTKNTYQLYKLHNRSYRNLFEYVQDLFDLIYT